MNRKGYRFPRDLILLSVRWYLSYRDLEEMLKERGLGPDHTTVYRWVQRFTPELQKAFRRWNNLIVQDHRRVKRRVGPMLGFKSFHSARVVLGGIEMVRSRQKRALGKGLWGGRYDVVFGHVGRLNVTFRGRRAPRETTR